MCCFEALGVLVWLILARSLDPAVCDMQPGKTAGNPNISASLCKKIRLYWVVDAEKVLDWTCVGNPDFAVEVLKLYHTQNFKQMLMLK